MSVEVCNMARCSSKSDELSNINSIGCRVRNITISKWEIDNFKIKIVTFILNFGRSNIIRNGQMQIQKQGFNTRGIGFIKLKLLRVYLTYYIVKIYYLCLKYHPNIWMHV